MSRPLRIGLRGKVVAALMITTAVTLVVAAVTLLSPLEHRLRSDEIEQLHSVATSSRASFSRLTGEQLRPGSPRLRALARVVSRRSDARVIVASRDGVGLAGNDIDPGERFPQAVVVAREDVSRTGTTRVEGVEQAEVAVPVQARDRRIVLVLRRSFGETTTAVDAVKRAFMWAALAGLATALLVGFALASGVVRRLRRLRDTTERVAEVGPEAELLEDPLHDEVGDLSRSFAAMQTQLRRQEQARRTFVSTASHELRTPLTALELMLDALAEDLARPGVDAADASRQVGLAQEQTRRLTRLAQDLLELSRVDAGLGLREDLTEVGELCRGVVTEFEAQAATRDLRIELVAPEPSWAVADPGGVVRIVRILVDNALRFSPPGEAVVVTVAGPPTGPAVTVADSGPGVPEPERERIFERFERGAHTDEDGGFGLGLAIGREVARGMRGELTLVESPRGAVFTLRLRPAPAGTLDLLEAR